MKQVYLIAILAAAGCAHGPSFRPVASMPEGEQRIAYTCFAQAQAAGAGVYNRSIIWQMAAQEETMRAVYTSCMLGQGVQP